MCCGAKSTASKAYVTPPVIPPVEGVAAPEIPVKPSVPDYPMPKKVGAYYGNPVQKAKK